MLKLNKFIFPLEGNHLSSSLKRIFLNGELILISIFSILMIAFAVVGGIKGYSAIPYWDMWDGTLSFAIKSSQGDWSVWWQQHNEHRIILSKILFWMDINWFGGLSMFLIAINYLIVFVSALTLCLIFKAYSNEPLRRSTILLEIFIFGWLFQWMQYQNFVWGFQSQFLLVQLLPLCAFFFLAKSDPSPINFDRNFLIACAFGVLSIGTMANGLIVLPMMIVYSLYTKQSKYRIGLLLILALVCMYFYLADYKSPGNHGSFFSTAMHDPWGLAKYAFVYLGSPFYYLSRELGISVALFSGVIFIIFYVTIVSQTVFCVARNPIKIALLFYIAFLVFTALITGGGRLIFGLQQALDSRYTTPAIMAWTSLLILYSPAILIAIKKLRVIGKIVIISICLIILSLQIRAFDSMEQLNFTKSVAGLALAMSIPDSEKIKAVYPSTEGALAISKAAQQKNFSFFMSEPFKSARKLNQGSLLADNVPQCIGFIDGVEFIAGHQDFVRVRGWLFNPATMSKPKFINFVGESNLVVGYAIVGGYRADLIESIGPESSGSGFEGYIKLDQLGSSIRAIGGQNECMSMVLKLPIQPFFSIPSAPNSDATKVSIKNIQGKNEWLGKDFDKSSFEHMSVYGSFINGDSDVGKIDLKIRAGDKLFYRSGPTHGKQIIEIPEIGASYVLPLMQNWGVLEFKGLPTRLGNQDILIRLIDNGFAWGEWSAIAVRN